MPEEPESSIQFTGDQDDHEASPPGYQEHLERAFVHKAGLGPHPGRYRGARHEIRHGPAREEREDPQEGDIQRLIAEEHPGEAQQQLAARQAESQPSPPQETLEQPPSQGGGGGGGGGGGKTGGGTPAAIGAQTVAQPPPAGEF
jgi:hypothetical protein